MSTRHPDSLRKDIFATAVLAALTLSFFWPIFAGRQIIYFGDLTLYFQPLLAFQRDELLRGRIPLWNPTILCGTPFVGNPQAWPLYPSSLLLWLLDAGRATGTIGGLHIFLAALGTYVFLRLRESGRAASLFAAIAWAFGGALVSKMQFPNMVQAAAYLPWLLWGIERVIRRPTAPRGAVLAALVGLALLAAHPQLTMMHLYAGFAWSVCRLRQCERRSAVASLLASSAVLGALLAAGQLLPVVELTRQSVRTGLTLQQASRFILPGYASLYNFIAPNFYGNPATAVDFVARGNFWESTAYVGKVTFGMAFGAIFWLTRRNFDARFWTAVTLLSVWLALGREAGLYSVAFHLLPGVAKFHDPARWLQLTTFGLACLSALGVDSVFESISRWPRLALRAIATAILIANSIDVCLFSATLNPLAPSDLFHRAISTTTRTRAYYADEGPLWGRFVSYRTYATEQGTYAAEFASALGPNTAIDQGYALVNGYEPVHTTATDVRLKRIAAASGAQRSALLRACGVQAVLRLDRRTNRPIVDHNAGAPIQRAYDANGRFTVEDIGPDEVEVELDAAKNSGMDRITLADSAYPGWHAFAAGSEAHVETNDLGLRTIEVNIVTSPADGKVTFRYAPTCWRAGVFLSMYAFGILMSIFAGSAASKLTHVRSSRFQREGGAQPGAAS